MSEHTIAHHHNSEPAAEVETVETYVIAPTQAESEPAAPSLPSVVPGAAAPAPASAQSYQVTLTLDAETHEYFRVRALADDRSLNKFLARELKRYVAAATAPSQN
jgi:hypothetical protein